MLFRPRSVQRSTFKRDPADASYDDKAAAKRTKTEIAETGDVFDEIKVVDSSTDIDGSAITICSTTISAVAPSKLIDSKEEREKILRERLLRMKLLKSKGMQQGMVGNSQDRAYTTDAEIKVEVVNSVIPLAFAAEDAVETAVSSLESTDNTSALSRVTEPGSEYLDCAISDVLGDKYRVMSTLGRGVFATVYRCIDVNNPYADEVAIKVLRKDSSIEAAHKTELSVLVSISQEKYISNNLVRFIESFQHSGHVCFVTENLHINLRQAMKQSGRGGRLSIDKIASYTAQLLSALRSLHELGYTHLDIKPDNIVLDRLLTTVKLVDFGSCLTAAQLDSRRTTSNDYLVARFYRAPELILGMENWSNKIDVWALGVTMMEAAAGNFLFHGANNSEVLWSIICLLGPPPDKVCRESRHLDQYFHTKSTDGARVFLKKSSTDPKIITQFRLPKTASIKSQLSTILSPSNRQSKDYQSYESDASTMTTFIDFISKCLVYDPNKRASTNALINHAFATSQSIY